jgi:nitroreductase
METLETIHKRASLKLHLSPRQIEQAKIDKVLTAARVAPSARNTQPWRFIVVKDKTLIEKLVSRAFSEVNRVARDAPIIIVACANPNDDVVINGKEYYLFDLGLAVENMVLAATDMGLATHIMAGIDEDELRRILDVPPEVRCPVIVLLAHTAEESYDEAAKTKLTERTRKNLSEFVYVNKWMKIG